MVDASRSLNVEGWSDNEGDEGGRLSGKINALRRKFVNDDQDFSAGKKKEDFKKNDWKEQVLGYLSSGTEIGDLETKRAFKDYLHSYNSEFERPEDLNKYFKKNPDFEGSEEREKENFNKFILEDFVSWRKHERQLAKEKAIRDEAEKLKTAATTDNRENEESVPKPKVVEEKESVEKDYEDKICNLRLNEKKVDKFADPLERIKILSFIETWQSGKVVKVQFNIEKSGNEDVISEVVLIARRKQGNKILNETVSLSREMFCSVFDGAFAYQKRDGENQGPVTGIGFLYGPKDFQHIKPVTSPEMAKEILGRVVIEGKRLSTKSDASTFDVVYGNK